jgi:hypothetical protein
MNWTQNGFTLCNPFNKNKLSITSSVSMCQPEFNHPQHMDVDQHEEPERRVRFSSDMVQALEIEEAGDRSLCWYSPDELNSFRQLGKLSSDRNLDQTVLDALVAISSKHCTQSAMDYWSLHGQSNRGFESFANPRLGFERKRQRSRCIKAVLIAQTIAREHAHAGKEMDAAKFLAVVSARESIVARKFAFMMGTADQNSVYRSQFVKRLRSSLVALSA